MRKKIQCNRCAKHFPDDKKGVIHIAGCRVYNGWATYESWLVALWIDNDHGSYSYWREEAQACAPDEDELEEPSCRQQVQVERLAERLKEEHEQNADERLGSRPDVYTDLLRAALSEVSWHEVAEHLLSE